MPSIKLLGTERLEPREYTRDEIRHALMKKIWAIIHYWKTHPDPQSDRMEGCVFSILAMLDGSSMDLPEFILIANPSPEDKPYCIERGRRYFAMAPAGTEEANVGGGLHEIFHQYDENAESYNATIAESPSLPLQDAIRYM